MKEGKDKEPANLGGKDEEKELEPFGTAIITPGSRERFERNSANQERPV